MRFLSKILIPLWSSLLIQTSAFPVGPRDTAPPQPSGPPGASGSLRGSSALLGYNPSNPEPTTPSTQISPSEFQLAPGQTEDKDLGLYIDLTKVTNPQPIRGETDSPTDPGPRTYAYDRLNSDLFIPPGTDSGDVPNAKWPFGLSHNRHGIGGAGWARQQNVDELPVATAMAGVDMRLSPHAYRELHWHKEGEWSLILNGSVRISAMNEAGESFIDDLTAGDVWFFPAGKSINRLVDQLQRAQLSSRQVFLTRSKPSRTAASFSSFSMTAPSAKTIRFWYRSYLSAIPKKFWRKTSGPMFRPSTIFPTVSSTYFRARQRRQISINRKSWVQLVHCRRTSPTASTYRSKSHIKCPAVASRSSTPSAFQSRLLFRWP